MTAFGFFAALRERQMSVIVERVVVYNSRSRTAWHGAALPTTFKFDQLIQQQLL